MNDAAVLEIGLKTLLLLGKVTAPVLLTALVVGLTVSLLQSVTQVQEFTLSFVPKAAAIGLVLLISGAWMLQELETFTRELFRMLPQLLTGA